MFSHLFAGCVIYNKYPALIWLHGYMSCSLCAFCPLHHNATSSISSTTNTTKSHCSGPISRQHSLPSTSLHSSSGVPGNACVGRVASGEEGGEGSIVMQGSWGRRKTERMAERMAL